MNHRSNLTSRATEHSRHLFLLAALGMLMLTSACCQAVKPQIKTVDIGLCYTCSDIKTCVALADPGGTGKVECDDSKNGICILSGKECSLTAYQAMVDRVYGAYSPQENIQVVGVVIDLKKQPVTEVPVQLFLPNGLTIDTATDNTGRFGFTLGSIHTIDVAPRRIDLGTVQVDQIGLESLPIFAYPGEG